MKILLLLLLVVALSACSQINQDERATSQIWGRMDQQCYAPGLYWYNPFSTSMRAHNVQVEKFEAKDLSAATSDVQEIHADIVVNFKKDTSTCHKLVAEIGDGYREKILAPATLDSLKDGTAHFDLATIIKNRDQLRARIKQDLASRLERSYLTLTDVSLTNFAPSKNFVNAVEQKQIAQQAVQRAEFERQQAEIDARSAVLRAKGQADSNRLLAESLRQSPETLRFKELEVMHDKWNGQLPQTILGGSASALIGIGGGTGRTLKD